MTTTRTSHTNCTHPATKAARAKCRRTRTAETLVGDAVARATDPFANGNTVEAKLDDAGWAAATIVSSHIGGWNNSRYFYVRMTRTGNVFEVHESKVR